MALQTTQGLYPNEGLARHEWQKHGTCSGKSPTDYFADVRRARDSIVIPAPFVAAKDQQTWTPIDIIRAFIAANARLRPGMLGVACANGVLQEVRICFPRICAIFTPARRLAGKAAACGKSRCRPSCETQQNAGQQALRLALQKDRELASVHAKSIRLGRKISGTHIQDIGFCGFQHKLAYFLVAPVVMIVGGREAEHVGNYKHLPIGLTSRSDPDGRRGDGFC